MEEHFTFKKYKKPQLKIIYFKIIMWNSMNIFNIKIEHKVIFYLKVGEFFMVQVSNPTLLLCF